MLDPEQLTYAQWFWIVFAMVVAVMFACRCIDLNYDEEPLVNDQTERQMTTGTGPGPGGPAAYPTNPAYSTGAPTSR